jgi:Type IV secretion-system coupling protein DNA-binding domain
MILKWKNTEDGLWPLDLSLVKLGRARKTAWKLEDALGGVLIIGAPGSGKTSGSGAAFARRFLETGFGGLVLCCESGEAAQWMRYLQDAGREADGRFFGQGGDLRFNFLEYATSKPGSGFFEDLVTLFMDLCSVVREGGPFWLEQRKKLLANAIALLLLAKAPIRLATLREMLHFAPLGVEQAMSLYWQSSSVLCKLLRQAEELAGSCLAVKCARSYWLEELLSWEQGVRDRIKGEINEMCDVLGRGALGALFCSDTNVTPEDILDGKIVVVDLSTSGRHREVGRYASSIWALLLHQAACRRRYDPPRSRPVFLWGDEARFLPVYRDIESRAVSRSTGIATVQIAQTLESLTETLEGDRAEVLLRSYGTKVFHAINDPKTYEWAHNLIYGERDLRSEVSAGGQPLGRLKHGGQVNNYIVEGIVCQVGRKWGNRRWILNRFPQRRSEYIDIPKDRDPRWKGLLRKASR